MVLEEIVKANLLAINNCNSTSDLEGIRIALFSKKGAISILLQSLKDASPIDRPALGKAINDAKILLEEAINNKKTELNNNQLLSDLELQKLDVTMPGYRLIQGSVHPLNIIIEEVEDYFTHLGYEVKEAYEVETDYYNFTAMNLAEGHPARAMHDSFYINSNTLLRTHTSPVQARVMEATQPPIKIICPGKVYRKDSDDATHSHQFMQLEGLYIDVEVSMADLKETLSGIIRHLFGSDREIRFRPSYFPFTEPSVEVDMVHTKADGAKVYIEVLGAGLVHPNVLKNAGIDPDKYSGFAFGIGIDRIAMIKYGIENIRHFYTNNYKFLKQFKGK